MHQKTNINNANHMIRSTDINNYGYKVYWKRWPILYAPLHSLCFKQI